jgi:isoamylase
MADIHEFQQMVARLHSAGIEVILDVVYNHTCEGNQLGPTLSASAASTTPCYYRCWQDGRAITSTTPAPATR